MYKIKNTLYNFPNILSASKLASCSAFFLELAIPLPICLVLISRTAIVKMRLLGGPSTLISI